MSFQVYIVGAGGFGREVWGWLQSGISTLPKGSWQLAGFLDKNPLALESFDIPAKIYDLDSFVPQEFHRLIPAIGDPATKLKICRSLSLRGAKFISFVHSQALIGPNCHLGNGCVLCPGSVITTNVTLGDFVALNVYSTVGHDAQIGPGCTLSGHADVTGNAILGEGVFLGSHAVVLPGVHVGDYARVGAGSVAIRHVKARSTVVGLPAKSITVPGKTALE